MSVAESIIEAIERELKRLGKPQWMRQIKIVIENCDDCPIDYDEWLPEIQILEILKSMKAEEGVMPQILFSRRFREMECFSFRCFRITDKGPSFWNPLEQKYKDFVAAGKTRTYQIEDAYPPVDIIQIWFDNKLPKEDRIV